MKRYKSVKDMINDTANRGISKSMETCKVGKDTWVGKRYHFKEGKLVND